MIWNEAAEVLVAAGLPFENRPYGLEARVQSPEGKLRLQTGRSSAGGVELSVTRESGLTSWFTRPSVAELVDLIVQAQQDVTSGRAASILDALLALDPR